MKLSELKKNPDNPRIIRDEKFERLKKSLREFPQMMELRPIVVDENGVVLGGNMRLEALKANGLREIPDEWVKRAEELTPEQKQEFIIKDNAGFGEWDWDCLANEWSDLPLSDWGVDVPDGLKTQFGVTKRVPKIEDCTVVKTPGKYRYAMPLDSETRERILPLAKPYPKRAASIENDALAHHAR